jgi:hypothetical protein
MLLQAARKPAPEASKYLWPGYACRSRLKFPKIAINVFRIYWIDENNRAHAEEAAEIAQALQITKDKRDAGYRFVTMASESSQNVGKQGVDTIVDGKTPDGHDYDWSKAGRAGRPRRNDKVITNKDH